MIRTLKTAVLATLLGLCLAPQAKAGDVSISQVPDTCYQATQQHWSFQVYTTLMTTPNAGTPTVSHSIIIYGCFNDSTTCNAARAQIPAGGLSQVVGAGAGTGNMYMGRALTACVNDGVGS